MKPLNYWKVVFGVSALIILATITHVSINGTDEEAVRILIRWSAKFSALTFSIAFAASSIHNLSKSKLSATILRYRPHIGLTFGTLHIFHLMFLIWLQQTIHPVFTLAKTTSLVGGGLAYLFIFAMIVTTFPKFKTKLSSQHWHLLHTIGGYWIWIIFTRSYAKQVLLQGKGYLILCLFLLVLVLRIIHLYHKRKNHGQA